jgi:hypothetical protein
MSPDTLPIGADCLRRAGVVLALVSAAAVLTACSSTGSNRGVVTVAQDELPLEMFLSQGYCPPIQIRPGTEALVVYERGQEEDPNFIRYQGSISRTARECKALGPQTLSIKVGIAGRLTVGPKGGTGSVTLPLRVAVVKQEGSRVMHTEVVNVAVTISGPPYSADFAQVVENITLQLGEEDRDLIVYVGFDEGPPKPTG